MNDLKDELSPIKKSAIILNLLGGDVYKKIFSHLVQDFNIVDNMQDAVRISYKHANPGDTVLLSPACSSFDLFKNYQQRGNIFKSCVLEI